MNRILTFFFLSVFVPDLAAAQAAPRPKLRTQLQKQVAVPGQVIVLDVTILVPTWMPKPPVFPSFETTDVAVRLPEGASRPAFVRIEGESWSGVTRSYELTPMIVGAFEIPPQKVRVTYAHPETLKPIVSTLRTPAVHFEGRAPKGAEDLDPFVAARSLTLEQNLIGDPENLEPGAAFSRQVTARVSGVSPIFLPPLIPSMEAEGLADYPKEPELSEKTRRGRISGDRTESVTYVAEAGGRFVADPIRLRWWNLRTQQIEVAEVSGFEISSRGPLPAPPTPLGRENLARSAAVAALLAIPIALLGRWLWPRFTRRRRARREAWLASEPFAFAQVDAALRARNFGEGLRAIEAWSRRFAPSAKNGDRHLELMQPLAAKLYGADPTAPSRRDWARARKALAAARQQATAADRDRPGAVLPVLNPLPNPFRSEPSHRGR